MVKRWRHYPKPPQWVWALAWLVGTPVLRALFPTGGKCSVIFNIGFVGQGSRERVRQ